MKRSVIGAAVLAMIAFAGLPATPARAAEVIPGMTLPGASTLVGFSAAEAAAKSRSTFTTSRINLEPDEGVWRYRVEGFGVRGQRVRVDVNAFTGAVIRARNEGGGGNRLSRDAAAIRAAIDTFTVSFAQAADIASAANAGFFVHDVRLELRGNVLTYKVEMVNATAAREVRLNPVGGAITSTQAGDDNGGGNTGGNGNGGSNGGGGADDGPNHDQNDDHGGASGNSGNSGSGNSGSGNSGSGNSGSGNSGSSNSGNSNSGNANSGNSNSGNSGSGNSGGTPPAGNIPNQPSAVAAAITNTLAGKPAGTQLVESRFVRVRNTTLFEVVTVAPGNVGAKTRVDLRTGNVAGTSGEQLGAEDLNRLASFQAALAGATPITPAAAITAAWNANHGDVLRVEPSVNQGRAVYEVRMLLGNRERTVKVNAVTGAVSST